MANYLQGALELVHGQTEYYVAFAEAFPVAPDLIFTSVSCSDPTVTSQLQIDAVVVARTANGFTAVLSQTPDIDTYVLSWEAGNPSIADSGGDTIGLSQLGTYSGSPPDNAMVPIIISGRSSITQRVTVLNLKNAFSSSLRISFSQITDATKIGRSLLACSSASLARSVLGVPSSDSVTDAISLAAIATTTGRNILSAANQSAVRSAIGCYSTTQVDTLAGFLSSASSFFKNMVGYANSSTLLGYLGAAPSSTTASFPGFAGTASLFGTSIYAARADHKHAVGDIVGSASINTFLASTTAQAYVEAISAMPDHGCKYGSTTISTSRALAAGDFGRRLIVTGGPTLTLSTITGIWGKLWLSVTGSSCTLAVSAGLYDTTGTALGTSYTLEIGYHELEHTTDTGWVLKNPAGSAVRQALGKSTLSALKTALAISATDLAVDGLVQGFLGTSSYAGMQDALGLTGAIPSVSSVVFGGSPPVLTVNLSDLLNGTTIAGVRVISQGSGEVVLDATGVSTLLVGQAFSISAISGNVSVAVSSGISVNGAAYPSAVVPVIESGSTREFTLYARTTGGSPVYSLQMDDPVTEQSSNLIWVSATLGNDYTAHVGRQDLPCATVQKAASLSNSTSMIIVLPGTYSVPNTYCLSMPNGPGDYSCAGASWYFSPGATISKAGGAGGEASLFSTDHSSPRLRVYGSGSFVASTATLPMVSGGGYGSDIVFECESINWTTNVFELGETGSGTALPVAAKVKAGISATSSTGAIFRSINYGSTVFADFSNALITCVNVVDMPAPCQATIKGGMFGVTTSLIAALGYAGATSKLRFIGQDSMFKYGSEAFVPATSPASGIRTSIIGCGSLRLRVTVTSGTGVMCVKDSHIEEYVAIGSDNLVLDNCTVYCGDVDYGHGRGPIVPYPFEDTSTPHNLYILRPVVLDAAIGSTASSITIVGATPIVWAAVGTYHDML